MVENTVSYSGSILRAAPTVLAASAIANIWTESSMARVMGSRYALLEGSPLRMAVSLCSFPYMVWRTDNIMESLAPNGVVRMGDNPSIFSMNSMNVRNIPLRCSLFIGALVAGGILVAAVSWALDPKERRSPYNHLEKTVIDALAVVIASTAATFAVLIPTVRNPVVGLLLPIVVYGAMSAFIKNQF